MAETEQILAGLTRMRLDAICKSPRFYRLDKLDAYFSGHQYDHLPYNWDGQRDSYAGEADIAPGWFVPLRHRKPSFRVELGKLIVRRFTSMMLGEERFPEVSVPGDPDAEDFLKTLAKEAKLSTRLEEARDKGGASGTAVMSFGFVAGKPRVHVHFAKHMHVLQWADKYEHRPAVVLKAYSYKRTVWVEGKAVQKDFYYAKLWTEDTETIWDPIPEELAKSGEWSFKAKSHTVTHDLGECPVYWAQNLPDSDQEDGFSDYDGLTDDFDEINRLASATNKGTVANVDPTLVIHADPTQNSGAIRKGSDNAIFAEKGAEYLELRGDSIKTAQSLNKDNVNRCLEVAGVVLADPGELSGAARSAAALKILYQPMVNQADKLRTQYGDLLEGILLGMLKAARKIGSQPGGPITTTEDGRRIQERPSLRLPPKVETERLPDGSEKVSLVERKPGTSEMLSLNWPAYFKPSLADTNQAVEAATKAKGTLVSDETATRFIAPLMGVEDVEGEVIKMQAEAEERAASFPGPLGTLRDDKEEPEDDDTEGEDDD